MITGAHAIVNAVDAEAARAFFRDVLRLPSVDAGEGWLIFAVPPAELGVHPADPADSGTHEFYFMADDIRKTVAELKTRGVEFVGGIDNQGWGIMARFKIPGGGEMGIYEPRHARPSPISAKPSPRTRARKPPSRGKPKPRKPAAKKRRRH